MNLKKAICFALACACVATVSAQSSRNRSRTMRNVRSDAEAAQELILSRPELEGYLITDTGTWTSDGFSLLIP